jgi:signal transduction histidine kinase
MRFPRLNIPQRITLWYGFVLILLWIILASEARQAFRLRMEREIYREVDRQWGILVAAAAHRDVFGVEDLERLHLVDLFQVNDAQGHLHQSEGWRQNRLHLALQQSVFNPYGSWERGRHLYYLKVLPRTGSLIADAVAFDATGLIQDSLYTLSSVYTWCFLLAGLLVIPGGYWVIGRVLTPMRAIFLKAFEIDAKRISSRLPGVNPDDEIGKMVFALNLTLDRLKKDFEQIQRFSANASHQLRTPLAVIRSLGEVALQTGETAAFYQEAISSILEEVERLSRLVDGLLLVARAESGQISLKRQLLDLNALAQSTVDLLMILAVEKKQRLSLEKLDSTPVLVDAMLFGQAISNLLDNAIRYTPEKGSIRMVAGRIGQRTVYLDIIDSGPGIPRKERFQVFEHFYRLQNQEKSSGTGLGLAFAYWVVRANGGTIEFLEPESIGAWCRITLPLASSSHQPEG